MTLIHLVITLSISSFLLIIIAAIFIKYYNFDVKVIMKSAAVCFVRCLSIILFQGKFHVIIAFLRGADIFKAQKIVIVVISEIGTIKIICGCCFIRRFVQLFCAFAGLGTCLLYKFILFNFLLR